MSKTKLFAMYLPQYHEIKENSMFWGAGFTDWVSVKKNTPLFVGHKQPRVPLNENYYDLSKSENIKWQCELAQKYGIDGFAIYHYWFSDSENLLTRPVEILLENEDFDINYFLAWDNTSWVRTWSKLQGNDWFPKGDGNNQNSKKQQILVKYELGEEQQWKNHYEYLLPFFRDRRYEKKENRPVFMILNPSAGVIKMEEYWNNLAIQSGFAGVYIIYRWDPVHVRTKYRIKNKPMYIYEPSTSGWGGLGKRIKNRIDRKMGVNKLKKYSYDSVWRKLLRCAKKNCEKQIYYCGFVGYDDTPRRGANGRVILGESPEKFKGYLAKLLRLSQCCGKEYLFLTAWNEWGEGAYLEPDEDTGYEYLEAVKEAKKSIE